MKTIKVKYGGFETEQCVDDALYDAIYEKGRADAKRESNEFFNFEGARELADTTTDCEDCERRIRADAIDKYAHALKETFNNEFPSNYHCTQPYFTLDNVRVLVDLVAKEQKQ